MIVTSFLGDDIVDNATKRVTACSRRWQQEWVRIYKWHSKSMEEKVVCYSTKMENIYAEVMLRSEIIY